MCCAGRALSYDLCMFQVLLLPVSLFMAATPVIEIPQACTLVAPVKDEPGRREWNDQHDNELMISQRLGSLSLPLISFQISLVCNRHSKGESSLSPRHPHCILIRAWLLIRADALPLWWRKFALKINSVKAVMLQWWLVLKQQPVFFNSKVWNKLLCSRMSGFFLHECAGWTVGLFSNQKCAFWKGLRMRKVAN